MERVIVKHHRVTDQRVAPSARERHAAETATVRLVREGDVVRALEITCACGERTTVELRYDGDAPPPVR
jgi:hypothetical protein